MALTANACDTGDYNDLDCDESYVSDCIAENAYMKCDLETKKLIVVQCAASESNTDEMSCHQSASGARCVTQDMLANKCEADVCASDALLHKCVDGIIEPVLCSGATPKCGIDATGKAACVSEGALPGESCTETVCDTTTNVIKVCVDGKVTETKRCSEDGSSICGTQGEGDAAVQACIPNPEYCDVSACTDDGKIKRCSEHRYVDAVACDDADESIKCFDVTTGEGDDAKTVGECRKSCTASACSEDNTKLLVCNEKGYYEDAEACPSGRCGLVVDPEGENDEGVFDCLKPDVGEECTNDLCGADGKIQKCIKEDGATTGHLAEAAACDAENANIKCFAVTTGDGNDAVTKGVCKVSCTADVCSPDGKIQKCVMENDATSGYLADAADCAVAGEKCFSVKTVTGETTTTQDVCKATCTEDKCVSSTTLNKCHKAEGAQEGYVEVETCETTEANMASVCMGNTCVNINKQQFIGAPCECTGADCDVVYNKAEIESFFSNAGKKWLGTVDDASKLKNGDEIRGANFFANSTCNALAAKLGVQKPAGLEIGCFRTTKVTFPEAFATLFSTEFAARIKKDVCKDSDNNVSDQAGKCAEMLEEVGTVSVFQNIVNNLNKVGDILRDGIEFTGPEGYCTMGALEMDGKLSTSAVKGTAIDIFSENAFVAKPTAENQVSLFSRFNGGAFDSISIPATGEGAVNCPEGSELYKYEIGKNFSESFGKATIHYALCLQKCEPATGENAASPCREGYQCMKLTENSYKGEKTNKDDRSTVCFPEENHTYMEETLKPAFNGFMLSLFK